MNNNNNKQFGTKKYMPRMAAKLIKIIVQPLPELYCTAEEEWTPGGCGRSLILENLPKFLKTANWFSFTFLYASEFHSCEIIFNPFYN